jgi:hypothetical protein
MMYAIQALRNDVCHTGREHNPTVYAKEHFEQTVAKAVLKQFQN